MPTSAALHADSININNKLCSSKKTSIQDDTSPRVEFPPVLSSFFFEGAEKRLAIQFTGCSTFSPTLRSIARSTWERSALDLVNCQVLSVTSNAHLDAYLLSESSMFVSDDRVMIKTCGTTTLLHCLPAMLKLGLGQGGFGGVGSVFYSHKGLLLPEAQSHPHQCFAHECDYLEQAFKRPGLTFNFGPKGSASAAADRFYMYTLNASDDLPCALTSTLCSSGEHYKFEIIMEQLDPLVMAHFLDYDSHQVKPTAEEVTVRSGIASLIPGMTIDAYLFDPCGYSMNGLLGPHYMTVHITPEPDFSYVSLEMNVPLVDYRGFVRKVLQVFNPGKFMVNLVVPSDADGGKLGNDLLECAGGFETFHCAEGKRSNGVTADADLIFARFVSVLSE